MTIRTRYWVISAVPNVVRHSRSAMASPCEIVLCGEDGEHLTAVAEAAFDEIARVEQCLTRFDPTSELSRINREAACGECLVSFELLQILLGSRAWWLRTERAFDITAGSRAENGAQLTLDDVQIDASRRLVRFRSPGVRLDLGAYGKGYALDCAARVLREQRITSGCLHIGTSSVLAIGSPPDTKAWMIGLRDPGDASHGLLQVPLVNASLSSSATRHSSHETATESDLVDPRTGQPVREALACTVIAPTASTAEALSTAFVVLGRVRAEKLLNEWDDASLQVFWPPAH